MNTTTTRFLLLAALWGSSFTFIKISLEAVTPGQLVLARLVLGAAVLTAIAAVRHVRLPRSLAIWGQVAVAALFGNVVPFLLLSYGEQSTGAGIAGVLIGATPLLTLSIASVAIPSEAVTRRKVSGLVVGFAGVVLVVGPWHAAAGSVGGRLACLGAASSYAIGYVYVRRLLSPLHLAPLALAAAQLLAAAGLQLLLTPFLSWHQPEPTLRAAGAVAVLGLLGTGLAYVLYFRIIGDVGATSASAVNYLVPVFAVVISVGLLGEPVTWNLVAGGLVVLAGVAYAESRVLQHHLLSHHGAADPQREDVHDARGRRRRDRAGGARRGGPVRRHQQPGGQPGGGHVGPEPAGHLRAPVDGAHQGGPAAACPAGR
jgi:drug/metabolite transporter (DMT)-like permease